MQVVPKRAEEWIHRNHADIVTGRAVAPLHKAFLIFARPSKTTPACCSTKGRMSPPKSQKPARKCVNAGIDFRILERYELPDALGERTIVEMARA